MDTEKIVNEYYRAWIDRSGDMSEVPLAIGFVFRGPVASFTDAEGFRAMARQAGAAVREFRVRHQFVSGDRVCSIIDWSMDPLPGMLTAAEVLRVRDGQIVEGELIYDAEDLRRVMAQATAGPGDLVGLLERGFGSTGTLLASITPEGWAKDSPCAGWTVRQVGNHLVGGLSLLERFARAEPVTPEERDAQLTADTDLLGADPAKAFSAVAERCLAAFSAPGALEREVPFLAGPASGQVLARICLLESLVHGWDIAQGAGARFDTDDAVVEAVAAVSREIVGEQSRAAGRFGPALPTDPGDPVFTSLLAFLGRRA